MYWLFMDISPWPPASHRCLRRHPDLLTCRAYRESSSLAAHTSWCDNKPHQWPLCVCMDSSTFLLHLEKPCIPSRRARWRITPPLWLTFKALPWGLPSYPGARLPLLAAAGQAASHAFKWTRLSWCLRPLSPAWTVRLASPCFFKLSGMMPPKGIKEHLSSTPPKYKAQHRVKQGVAVEEVLNRLLIHGSAHFSSAFSLLTGPTAALTAPLASQTHAHPSVFLSLQIKQPPPKLNVSRSGFLCRPESPISKRIPEDFQLPVQTSPSSVS